MSRLFDFAAEEYSTQFAERGYVHIPGGLDRDFHQSLLSFAGKGAGGQKMEKFRLGNKQQTLYDFPSTESYHELFNMVGSVCGLNAQRLVISERHIKSYDSDADP